MMPAISGIARINLSGLEGCVPRVLSILMVPCRCIFQRENELLSQVYNDNGPLPLELPNKLLQIMSMRTYIPQASKT